MYQWLEVTTTVLENLKRSGLEKDTYKDREQESSTPHSLHRLQLGGRYLSAVSGYRVNLVCAPPLSRQEALEGN